MSDLKLTREQGESLNGTWALVEVTADHREYHMDMGNGKFARKIEHIQNTGLLQLNHEDMADSQTQRFGDGKVVARIPMNVFFDELAGRVTDKDHLKWWLNDTKNGAYRSFRGKV